MQTLKSLLVVVLVSFCVFQSSATVLPATYSSVEVDGIIEWGDYSRTIFIQANVYGLINVTLSNSNGELVYENILTGNSGKQIIDLHHLAPGIYKFTASCASETVYGTVILE